MREDSELESLQRDSFEYFLRETNPRNGLVLDKTAPDWPASIAATGLALAAYPVAVERGFITRTTADAVYIGHTREHVAGAPRYEPHLVERRLDYFFNLYPYYGYPPSFGLITSTVGDPIVKSETNETNGSGE